MLHAKVGRKVTQVDPCEQTSLAVEHLSFLEFPALRIARGAMAPQGIQSINTPTPVGHCPLLLMCLNLTLVASTAIGKQQVGVQ